MTEIILFGGTTEGRALGELFGKKRIKTLLCVATEYGEALLTPFDSVCVHMGRLEKPAMENLLETKKPRLVIDATHPYAQAVSDNISAACQKIGVRYLRVLRENAVADGCVVFPNIKALINWLNNHEGTIFSTLGAKEAAALTAVSNYQERLWLRILPDTTGLSACLAAGFSARHIICMQGQFSKELNAAMYRETRANILLTKESGKAGGYPEKLEAARECGMTAAVLSRPKKETGLTLADMVKRIEEDAL